MPLASKASTQIGGARKVAENSVPELERAEKGSDAEMLVEAVVASSLRGPHEEAVRAVRRDTGPAEVHSISPAGGLLGEDWRTRIERFDARPDRG